MTPGLNLIKIYYSRRESVLSETIVIRLSASRLAAAVFKRFNVSMKGLIHESIYSNVFIGAVISRCVL